MNTLKDFLELLSGTSEACGYPLSDAAAKIMAADLQDQDFNALVKACARCRRELKHRLTLADILERLQATDGRLTADEAWARFPKREEHTRLITDEMERAAEDLYAMINSENPTDQANASKTFKERYTTIVANAREHSVKPIWRVSEGVDSPRDAIAKGLKLGVLSVDYCRLAFSTKMEEVDAALVMADMGHLRLMPPTETPEQREASKTKALEAKNAIMLMLSNKTMDDAK